MAHLRPHPHPPPFHGQDAKVDPHSMVTSGCEVYGTVENSVLFHSVTVEEGAVVRYSILMRLARW